MRHLKLVKPFKPFTVDLAHKYYEHNYGPFKEGDRVKTTQHYTGWTCEHDRYMSGTVIQTLDNTTYEVADFLQEEGFTCHSVYEVKFDNADVMVIWPQEIEPE